VIAHTIAPDCPFREGVAIIGVLAQRDLREWAVSAPLAARSSQLCPLARFGCRRAGERRHGGRSLLRVFTEAILGRMLLRRNELLRRTRS
jgi:hypothetical protein